MRGIKYIAIHCTATQQTATIQGIKDYWRNVLKWKTPGYHIIISPDGSARELLPINKVSNGVKGYNSKSINISYIGGINKQGKPKDTRTKKQKETLLTLVKQYKDMFPEAIVQGHRDFPQVSKSCPCFNAKDEYKNI